MSWKTINAEALYQPTSSHSTRAFTHFFFLSIHLHTFCHSNLGWVESYPNTEEQKCNNLTIKWLNVPAGAFNHRKLKWRRIRKLIPIYSSDIDEVILVAHGVSRGREGGTVIVEILHLDGYCSGGSFGRNLYKTVENVNNFDLTR